MIPFKCPNCGAVYQVADQQANTKLNCSKCGQRVMVPPAPSRINKTVLGEPVILPQTFTAVPTPSPIQQAAKPNASKSPTETAQYYYMNQGVRKGPMPFDRLQHLARTKQLDPPDLVWSQEANAWVPAKEIPGLFSNLPILSSSQKRFPVRLWITLAGVALVCVLVLSLLYLNNSRSVPPNDTGALVKAKPGTVQEEQKKPDPKTIIEEPPTPKELTSEEIVALNEKAVALIESPVGHGTGFLVRPGLIATNAHIIELATIDSFKIFFPSAGEVGKKPISAIRVAYFDRKRDLALLEIKSDLLPLKLAQGYNFKKGQAIIVIGNPGLGKGAFKFENAVVKGITSSEANLPGGFFFQLNVAVNPGNSGGPVIDPNGQVIGVIQSRAVQEEGIALAIPIDELTVAIVNSLSKTPKEKELLTSNTNARTVFLRTAKAGKIYHEGALFLERSWQDALLKFGSILPSDLNFGRNQFFQIIRKNNLEHISELKDLEQSVTAVGTDPNLTDTTRQRIADLWQVCDTLRLDFLAPVGTLIQFRERCNRNYLRMEELVGSLRITLGVEQEQLNIPLLSK